jgi:hypothetical protein
LALVGVSLASGSGLITKEDELECVCREVNNNAEGIKRSIYTNNENSVAQHPATTIGLFLIGVA